MTALLRDLARAKATFQARALRAILTKQPKGKPMTEAPERIWAYTNDGYGDRMTDHGTWDTGIEGQPDCHPEWPHAPYIRADLVHSPAPDVRDAVDRWRSMWEKEHDDNEDLRAENVRLREAAQWARDRLEMIADDSWNGDARDFKRLLVGVFADFDAALATQEDRGMSEAEWRDGDDPELRALLGYALRDHVSYQDGRHSEAPALLFADYDFEVGDGTCGVAEDGKRCNEPAIVYARADALLDAIARAEKAEAQANAERQHRYSAIAEIGRQFTLREKAEAAARTAYARGIGDAAGAVAALRGRDVPKRDAQDTGEAFDFAIDEAQAAIRALAPDPEDKAE